MDTKELKFSEMEYDTTEAKKLFAEHPQFFGTNFKNTKEFVEDNIGNRICVSGLPEGTKQSLEALNATKKLWRLSELIEENVELFCQLEYAIRKIQPDELKAFDLKLIVQNLIYYASRTDPSIIRHSFPLQMCDDSPLVSLARAAEQYVKSGSIRIISERQTAVVCWLFADLCNKAGFNSDEVSLCFVKKFNASEIENMAHDTKELDNGCFAVVTAKSDLDSAVDVLVESPDRNPWRVRRILVQESVLHRFRTSLEDKARRKSGAEVDEVLLHQCTSGCRYEGKTFLFGFVGREAKLDRNSGIILVEAYRTAKELLALLNNFKPYALSVWNDSVAESNEICHSAPSNIIWINCFGIFDGPPEASQSFFSAIKASSSHPCMLDILEPKNLSTVWKSWSTLPISERAEKIKKVYKYNKRLHMRLDDSFYYVFDKFICAGTETPFLFHHIINNNSDTGIYISELLTFVVKGGGVVLDRSEEYPKSIVDLASTLSSAGAPVGWTCDTVDGKTGSNCVNAVLGFVCRTKVVWTSYGTIFSN